MNAIIRMAVSTAVFAALTMALPANAQQPKPALKPEQFDAIHALIKPARGEARWAEVAWMPSNNIWAARKKAAVEGKPILLWYMAGEPLGTC
jgi:hypothetical protein